MKLTFFLILMAGVLARGALAGERDVIINEIMYHPPEGSGRAGYIELHNRGSSQVSLSGWRFTKGVRYTFPQHFHIPGGGFLVVCEDLRVFVERHGAGLPAIGDFEGKLSRGGERLELVNARNEVIDSVKYSDKGDWPRMPDGQGASLERISPAGESDHAENWAASAVPQEGRPGGTPGRRNDRYSASPLPGIRGVGTVPERPTGAQPTTIAATVSDADGIQSVSLMTTVVSDNGESSEEEVVAMRRVAGDEKQGRYEAVVPPVGEGRLVRYRVKAVDVTGAQRIIPEEGASRPTFTYATFSNTNSARVPIGFVVRTERSDPGSRQRYRVPQMQRRFGAPPQTPPARPNGAFIYVPPDGGEVEVFDHVRINPRNGGFKVRFNNDQPLRGMTGINVIFEGGPRWILAEPLAYELYRMAGVPAEQSEHIRIYMDGQFRGYQLLVEQPNKSFLARHFQDDSGDLYKLLWYGSDVISKHEKKTNPETGHDPLLQVINGLNRSRGPAQWEYIQEHFAVEGFINYYAVNMCIQNWDGFFNNYFVYHDTGRSRKWHIIPWDEDKTWGDFDGASSNYDWYEMPLTMGMTGDRPPSTAFKRSTFRGPWGGPSWWRPAGYFSGPMLANPEFRRRMLARLGEICETVFTEEKFLPVIDEMERRLLPEIQLGAQVLPGDPRFNSRMFRANMQSFREQLVQRRKFILAELKK